MDQVLRVPVPFRASPAAGSDASRQVTFTFADPHGWQHLGVVNILINSALDGKAACYLAYSRPDGILYLVNDRGDGLLQGVTLMGGGTVSNSQCTVSGTGS